MNQLPAAIFKPLAIDERPPHDGTGTGKGWSFKTLEHDAHNFPHAIEGRSAIYVPLKRRGRIGKWMLATSSG
jgi:hypothetical protein